MEQIRDLKGFQYENLAAGKEGSDDLEGGILRSGTYKDYGSVLNGSEQGILLGLVETMDFVNEEYGCTLLGEEAAAARLFKNITDILDSGGDR